MVSKYVIQRINDETGKWEGICQSELGWRDKSEYLSQSKAEEVVNKLARNYRYSVMADMREYVGVKRGRDAKIYSQSMEKVARVTYRYIEDEHTLGE